ncbi:hypothetical protein [Paralysiella testudinis]|uniref:Lipoprotein n=1 Tax=Paralysiella testudinis TaxID=2809020 RepID=A0A892ZFE0_9NEIS|nr:hypothetical protein [Paralysiella testudinis]QRQ81198.1 hypothetical protein JQU52_10775 [Paralysiella testudinis]
MKIFWIMALSTLGFSGCALIEPTASLNVQTQNALSRQNAIACAASALAQMAKTQKNWNNEPMITNGANGTLETGDFSKANVIGIRTKLVYTPEERRFKGKIKANGLYFSDLGAQKAATDLETMLVQCR